MNKKVSFIDKEIKFSKWYRWDERDEKNIPNIKKPGVYILAIFDKNVPKCNVADHKDEHIIYIGETCRTLHTRLNQFNRSAFEFYDDNGKPKKGHSGGKLYRDCDKLKDKEDKLYVAVFTIDNDSLSDKIKKFQIRYVERKLILEIAEKYYDKEKVYPLLNKK